MYLTRNQAYVQAYRGFESLPLRQIHMKNSAPTDAGFFMTHIPVRHPAGGCAVENGAPAVFSWRTSLCITLQAAAPWKTAVLPFFQSE